MALSDRIEAQAQRHLRHNIVVNMADASWWLFGISFISTTTILPVYISHLTTSSLLIGLIPALESLGWYLPQIFTAPYVERLGRVKPLLMITTMGERLPFLLIGAAIVLFPATEAKGANLALVLFFVLFSVRVFASGISAIPWQEMIARVIPGSQRGRFFAGQRVLGGIAGLFGAIGAGEILAQFSYPLNFALCFFCCFVAVLISYVCLMQTYEPRQVVNVSREQMSSYWRELPDILSKDHNFVLYLVGRAISLLGSMATAFFAVHAVQRFGLGDAEAAVFTGILLVTNIVTSGPWGWLGDKWGQKLVLAVSLMLYGLGLALAWLSDTLVSYYFVFIFAGVANAGLIISDLALVLDFAPAGRRPTYMGIARGLLAPWIGVAPVLGGVLATQFGYSAMIVVSGILTLMGLALLTVRVKEPRQIGARSVLRASRR